MARRLSMTYWNLQFCVTQKTNKQSRNFKSIKKFEDSLSFCTRIQKVVTTMLTSLTWINLNFTYYNRTWTNKSIKLKLNLPPTPLQERWLGGAAGKNVYYNILKYQTLNIRRRKPYQLLFSRSFSHIPFLSHLPSFNRFCIETSICFASALFRFVPLFTSRSLNPSSSSAQSY